MTFLYVGLGIAMLSGISAMMTIGNNINNLLLLSSFEKDQYINSSLPNYDRKIWNILEQYVGPESEVCPHLIENLKPNSYQLKLKTISKNSLFINSCVLENKNLKHRVLIKKNNIGRFNLFSCYKGNKSVCPFELDK
tara:strand:+ start:803 stop:1213 length:411 start_codon:yes stop_codon:yes gene_type:complete